MWHWPSGKVYQGSVVKTVTPGYRLDDPGFDCWKLKEIFSPAIHPGSAQISPTRSLRPSPSQWVLENLSPTTRQMWHEADHSLSSTATITTVCSHMSSHPTCPHGMHSDNFYHLASIFPKSKIITQQQNTKYSSVHKLHCKANINTVFSYDISVTEHICNMCEDAA
jgi:hypothetical protein